MVYRSQLATTPPRPRARDARVAAQRDFDARRRSAVRDAGAARSKPTAAAGLAAAARTIE